MKTFISLILALASSLALGQSPAVQTWNADNIVWQRTDSDGTKWAVLEGDKDAPGKAFTYEFFLPASDSVQSNRVMTENLPTSLFEQFSNPARFSIPSTLFLRNRT